MSKQTASCILVAIPLLLFASCRGDLVTIQSENEPADDPAALRLAGITTTPLPRVVFRAFEGGLDDNMRIVIRVPKTQLSSFWSSSPWHDAERKELFPHKAGATFADNPSLPGGSEPEWERWKASSHGIMSEAQLPDVKYVRIYLALDEDDLDAVGYVLWFET